jgi:hypothetical protein
MTAAVTAEVWNAANMSKVADLSTSTDGPLSADIGRVANSEGIGSVEVLADNPGAASLTPRRCVRIKENGTHVGTFFIKRTREVVVDGGEEASQRITASGPGLLGRFDDAIVLPWVGAGKRPASRTRVFNWASPNLPVSGWTDTIYEQARTVLLWGGTRPVNYLDPFAAWIWGAADATSHAAGSCYFRRTFTLSSDALFVPYLSFDDECELWLDGTQLLSQTNSAEWDNWWWTWKAPLRLPAGTHTIAAAVTNASSAGPGGFLLSGWLATEGGGIAEDGLVVLTGAPDAEPVGAWKCKAYPTTAPGWTPGRIIKTLLAEAQARGSLAGWTTSFDNDEDSDGNPWPEVPEFSVNVGATVGRALADLAETWVDVDVSLSGTVLHAWDKAEGRGSASGVTYAAGTNVTQLVREAFV